MTENQDFKVGDRVTKWGSHRVGTVTKAFPASRHCKDSACVVVWDSLRDKGCNQWEAHSYEFSKRLTSASDYAKRWNAYGLRQIKEAGGERKGYRINPDRVTYAIVTRTGESISGYEGKLFISADVLKEAMDCANRTGKTACFWDTVEKWDSPFVFVGTVESSALTRKK